MSDKKYSGNFYKTDKVEEPPDDCPSCIYQNKKAEKDPDECPNCYYIPNRNSCMQGQMPHVRQAAGAARSTSGKKTAYKTRHQERQETRYQFPCILSFLLLFLR